MEFRDLKKQYMSMKEEMDHALQSVLSAGSFIGGELVTRLEDSLAEYVGVKHCITCANGTDALQLALMAWEIGEGDAVFVPDFTFFSTAEVIPWVGATPVFVDVNYDTFNLSAPCLKEAIEKVIEEGRLKPKAIIAVDLFGQSADYSSIKALAEQYGLFLLEDGAQGFGGAIGNRPACSFGDIATTSFFPAKPLGCYGDGGAVFTDNDEWAELIASYKVHGRGKNKYDNVRIGINSRLDTIQAGVLLVKFKQFVAYEMDAVNKAADLYSNLLKDMAEVQVPVLLNDCQSSWAQYTIKLRNRQMRDELQEYLKQNHIPSMVYYPKPLHKQKAFSRNDIIKLNYENTEKLCDTVLSLPIHPYISEKEQEIICKRIEKFLIKTLNCVENEVFS